MPLAMSLPSGSFRTSGGVMLLRWSPGFWMPIQRAVWTEPSWLMNEIQALLVCTFCATPRFGTTMTPRAGVVRAALGRVDGAVDLHVRRHRIELAVGRRIDRHAETVADGERLRSGRCRLLCDQHATEIPKSAAVPTLKSRRVTSLSRTTNHERCSVCQSSCFAPESPAESCVSLYQNEATAGGKAGLFDDGALGGNFRFGWSAG